LIKEHDEAMRCSALRFDLEVGINIQKASKYKLNDYFKEKIYAREYMCNRKKEP